MAARKQLKLVIFITYILALAACGQNRSWTPHTPPLNASTGYFDAEGIDYTDGGDPRVAEALKKSPPDSASARAKLGQRIKEFEISRYQKGAKKPAQFGHDRAEIKVFFTDRNPVTFSSPLTTKGTDLEFSAEAGGFALSGFVTDTPAETKGEFRLSRVGAKDLEPAHIFYRAYKGRLDVRAEKGKMIKVGSSLDRQMRALKDGTFAWVHNWVVVHGPSFYLVDFVQDRKLTTPLIAFKGDSKRTGEVDHEATPLGSATRTEIRLIGNSEEESRRLFAVQVRERADLPAEEFLLDVIWDAGATAAEPPLKDEGPPKAQKSPFLRHDLGGMRAQKMIADFDRNFNLNGVQAFIADYQGRWRRDLQNFYDHANPFRTLIEQIAEAFEVSPAFAYLSAIESSYFTGGRYKIESAATSTALGPFQLLVGTAEEVGLRVNGGGAGDERLFFAPSACGAARYVRKLVDSFNKGDATLAILAYFQGYSRAAGFARHKNLANEFGYTYAEMDRLAVLPIHMRQYVNKKLAAYFISADMAAFGFSLDDKARTHLPENGTVFPPAPMRDQKCQAVAEGFSFTQSPTGT